MRKIIMLVSILALVVVMAVPAFAAAGGNTTCKESSSGSAGFDGTTNNGQGKQARADAFFGGSVGEEQQAHCNPKQVG
jgi:hypothetical protein